MAEVTGRQHITRNLIVMLVGTAIIGSVATWRIDIWDGIKASWIWLGQSSTFANWWLIALWTSFVILAIVSIFALFEFRTPLEHTVYTEDRFFGMIWRWSWAADGAIENLWCFCQNCDRRLVFSDTDPWDPPHSRFICEHCQHHLEFDGRHNHVLNRVKREIEVRIRNGSWKHVVEAKIAAALQLANRL